MSWFKKKKYDLITRGQLARTTGRYYYGNFGHIFVELEFKSIWYLKTFVEETYISTIERCGGGE